MQEVGSGLSLDLTLDAAGAVLDISTRQGAYKSKDRPIPRLVALGMMLGGRKRQLDASLMQVAPHCAALDWCRLRDLNPRPSVYKTAALPLC
jgi:hypothetical protein